jgi:LysR family pca operon transcriptional activator
VVAGDLKDGALVKLPIDTSETKGSVGLTTRADTEQSPAVEIVARTIKETVKELGL